MSTFVALTEPTLDGILGSATGVLTWILTSMGSVLESLASHPLILCFFFFTIAGIAFSFVFRAFRSLRG